MGRHAIIVATLLGLGGSGCYSGLQQLEPGADDNAFDDGNDGDDGGESDSGGEDTGPLAGEEQPAPTTRLFRLTHAQWENTVQDLLYLAEPTGLSTQFRADPYEGGFIFDNNALSLEVDQALWSGYQRAAADVAELVASDPAIIAAVAPDTGDEATRIQQFIEQFGQRAFRRPLTDDERLLFAELFAQGNGLYEDTTGFEAGIRLTLEAMLQSPHFIYRVERSEEIVDGIIPLDSFEIASRLSYFLWNSMPDDELLAAAAAGQLSTADQVREHARRMVDGERAVAVAEHFHHQLLHVERFLSAAPSAMFYPDAPEDLGALAIEEHQRFLEHTIFDEDGSWRDLLTSTETFVNDRLAPLYGLEGDFSSAFERVSLPPDERRGLFTQIGFLASNATTVNPDPIHRGVFLTKTIACHHLAAPPDDIPALPAPDATQTNREAVASLTEVPGSQCEGCHKALINPFGFALENYDATGAYRATDNGQPVDASATVLLSEGPVDVDDALDLMEAMAEDRKVHRCYAKHWLEFAMARPYAPQIDDPLLDRLAEGSLDDLSVKDLLVEMAASAPFIARATEEIE